MKLLGFLIAVPLVFSSGLALADDVRHSNPQGYFDQATVLSAEPVYRSVEVNSPRQQCWNEPVRSQVESHSNKPRSHTSMILGSIIGAAIGNRFGSGRGKDAATVAGAVLGGSVGRDVSHANNYHHSHTQERVSYERRCETVDQYHTEQQLTGYDVRYRYKGKTYWTHTREHPGDRLTVSINVTPVGL